MTFQSHPFPYVMTFVTCLVTIFVSTDKELFSSDDNIWPSLIPRVMVNTSRSRVGAAATYIQWARGLFDHQEERQGLDQQQPGHFLVFDTCVRRRRMMRKNSSPYIEPTVSDLVSVGCNRISIEIQHLGNRCYSEKRFRSSGPESPLCP